METIDQIKIDEGGYQAEVYLCSAGKLTWLYGRNIDSNPIRCDEWYQLRSFLEDGKTQKRWAESIFEQEITSIKWFLNEWFLPDMIDIYCFPEDVRNIMINMAYNMGTTKFNPNKWPKFFKAIKEQNWKQAAIEGRDSKWFNQVGQRSVRLMNSLENVV